MLSGTTDPEIAAQLRGDALNNTDVFTGRQAMGLLGGLLGNSVTKDATWEWTKTNFDAFVKARVPDARLGAVPRLARGFCDAEKSAEIKAFFESKIDIIPGSERSLAQTLERVNLCAGFVKAKRDELAKALAER